MKLILGGINGNYLRNITLNAALETTEVLAAVAYANDASLLIDWCWDNKISLRFWGRLDDTVPVSVPILAKFLERKSAVHVCKLVQHHHAKVIWWQGVGVYIGSANLTGSAWYKNIEAGCFFEEGEIDQQMALELSGMFEELDRNSTPLTNELLAEMERRAKDNQRNKGDLNKFWNSPSFNTWPGLIQTSPKSANDRQKKEFLKEWHATLQILRDIGTKISIDANRPSWIESDTASGAQADQFLHAHYYQRTFEGRRADFQSHFIKNKDRTEQALLDTIEWWRALVTAPNLEDEMLNERAPFLQKMLSADHLPKMTEAEFLAVCGRVHAIIEYARRVSNKSVFLKTDGRSYTIPEKIDALAHRMWNSTTSNGARVNEVFAYILYGGSNEQLPERLWQSVSDSKWKIDGLGISALGEIVGWALPDIFPPRNGRTSKALRSLGYDVTVHV